MSADWTRRLQDMCENPPIPAKSMFTPIRHVQPNRCVDSPFLIGTGVLTMMVLVAEMVSPN